VWSSWRPDWWTCAISASGEGPVSEAAARAAAFSLALTEPAAYAPDKRLDVIHEPDLDLLWGGQE